MISQILEECINGFIIFVHVPLKKLKCFSDLFSFHRGIDGNWMQHPQLCVYTGGNERAAPSISFYQTFKQ